jgi:hypothetical protein
MQGRWKVAGLRNQLRGNRSKDSKTPAGFGLVQNVATNLGSMEKLYQPLNEEDEPPVGKPEGLGTVC